MIELIKRVSEAKAVLFDLDGTLIDSMGMWKDIDVNYLAGFGIEYEEGLQEIIGGMNFNDLAVFFQERFHITDPVEKIKNDWYDMAYEEYRYIIKYKSGAEKFLKKCRELGVKTAVVTSNSKVLVDAVCQNIGLDKYIDVFITCDDIAHGKPEPDGYLAAAKALAVEAEDCIVFEDIPEGIISGKRAGMFVCSVGDEYSSDLKAEKQSLADIYIEGFDDVC